MNVLAVRAWVAHARAIADRGHSRVVVFVVTQEPPSRGRNFVGIHSPRTLDRYVCEISPPGLGTRQVKPNFRGDPLQARTMQCDELSV